jgi:hypothetical protein
MMDLFREYQCPYCLNWFYTKGGGETHSERCESVRWKSDDSRFRHEPNCPLLRGMTCQCKVRYG